MTGVARMDAFADWLMQAGRPHALLIAAGGAALVAIAVAWLFSQERQTSAAAFRAGASRKLYAHPAPDWPLSLLLLMLVAALLRFAGLDAKTISHPEIFIPGLPLPFGISEPPPRLDLYTVAKWHFLLEPHPIGYYLVMYGWTKVFGTSVFALRLPSAVLGVLSIPLIYRIGTLVHDRKSALIAAGLLALHGFHVYWSQMARMYVPECFFGLLATWLLLEILQAPSRGRELAYVLALLGGLSTDWFFWSIVGCHAIFIAFHLDGRSNRFRRLLYLQTLAMVLGAFYLTQAAITSGGAGSGNPPSVERVLAFLGFTFLLEGDPVALQDVPEFPLWLLAALAAMLVALFGYGVRTASATINVQTDATVPRRAPLLIAVVGMTAAMIGLAMPRLPAMRPLAAAFIPAIILLCYVLAPPLGRLFRARTPSDSDGTHAIRPIRLIALLAVLPPVAVYLASTLQPMVVARAFVVFMPYPLIVAAVGLREFVARHRGLGIPGLAFLAITFAISLSFYHAMPTSSRDYAAIATFLSGRMQPNDRLLVPSEAWYASPLFYYVDAKRLVTPADAEAIGKARDIRLWTIVYPDVGPEPELARVLENFVVSETDHVDIAQIQLYVRPPPH